MVGGRPGPAPQTAKREQFVRLIAAGVSNSEACRIVGINRRTGKRWRHGRTITVRDGRKLHYPPVISARKQEISSRYLSEDERVRIADLRRQKLGVRQIAGQLGRSPSTISRELRRNVEESGGTYRPFAAQRMAVERRSRPRPGKLVTDAALRAFVAARLKLRWSPEQICAALRRQFPGDRARHVVPETIYQAVYRADLGGLAREFPRGLRTGRRRRKPHRHPDARRAGSLVGMTMIDARPAEAATRTVPGHWEGDLITGESNRSAIGTLVERASRFTILLHLPGRHTAEAVTDALVTAFSQLPVELRRSLTWDQGKEMALHRQISDRLGMPVFFCQKASPWQRPSNENTNGLLRQYFPKGSNLRVHDAAQVAAVAAELNDRPRKTLGWDTPAARLQQLITLPEQSLPVSAPSKTDRRRSPRRRPRS